MNCGGVDYLMAKYYDEDTLCLRFSVRVYLLLKCRNHAYNFGFYSKLMKLKTELFLVEVKQIHCERKYFNENIVWIG